LNCYRDDRNDDDVDDDEKEEFVYAQAKSIEYSYQTSVVNALFVLLIKCLFITQFFVCVCL